MLKKNSLISKRVPIYFLYSFIVTALNEVANECETSNFGQDKTISEK